ncbi:UNVERIFIED_CONTAM: hypothetical protein HDU68_002682 [Siphonaria sp. JEL0065]|nr:hypothetical protein HDU68_002682 [Siphonaria sp. JEL0065]
MTLDSTTQFIEQFNTLYEQKHKAFEDNFWATKMNLKGCSSDELTRTKNELDTFLGDASMLQKVQELLKAKDLSPENEKTLKIFERTFKCYIITDKEGIAMREDLNRLEAKLAEDRRAFKLGYTDPVSKQFVEASSVQLRSIMRTSENEELRKACFEGMRSIGPFVAPQFLLLLKDLESTLCFPFYEGATMQLDLCDRQGKYSNGFCHWPQPAWTSSTRGWVPSQANFTSLATPGQVGSGHTALVTLMHEGGHAAHFANVKQPSPLFSQERAPTSIPYAENQSMFLDSLVGDAAWLGRYALSKDGKVIPWELVEREIRTLHSYKVFALTSMLAVPIFERRLYEMPEDKLTVEAMLALADQVELEVQGVMSSRPLLAVPHPLTDESAAYYHGYVLADMAVHQTRKHFLKKYGYIVDNPQIGKDLKEIYWQPGNSSMFLDLVKEMTGEDLSGDAWIEMLEENVDELVVSERKAYEEAVKAGPKYGPKDKVYLDMRVILVHGDEVISDSSKLKGGLSEACEKFEQWIGVNFHDKNLSTRLATQFDTALGTGHLIFTPSTCVIISSGSINFQIRFAPSLAKKPTGGLQKEKSPANKPPFNPFLAPEPELLVDSTLVPTHNILLNKFSITKGHTIITTKKWESQSSLLKEGDFKAAFTLLENGNEYLGFYNCGPLSGASVPHKHMQFIPVQRGSVEDGLPIQGIMETARETVTPFQETVIPGLPYHHRASFIPLVSEYDSAFYSNLENVYTSLVKNAFADIGVDFEGTLNHVISRGEEVAVSAEKDGKVEVSYNVIFTREWIIVVPRRAETFEGISVNSVGFSGMLLAKREEEVEQLKIGGVERILQGVAHAKL